MVALASSIPATVQDPRATTTILRDLGTMYALPFPLSFRAQHGLMIVLVPPRWTGFPCLWRGQQLSPFENRAIGSSVQLTVCSR